MAVTRLTMIYERSHAYLTQLNKLEEVLLQIKPDMDISRLQKQQDLVYRSLLQELLAIERFGDKALCLFKGELQSLLKPFNVVKEALLNCVSVPPPASSVSIGSPVSSEMGSPITFHAVRASGLDVDGVMPAVI